MALSCKAPSMMRQPQRASRPQRTSVVKTQALLPAVAIGGSTACLLALGRFVFLPYQRREANWNSQLPPKTSGDTFFDRLQKPSSFVEKSNDPAGFGIIDVMGWGALGHVFGYALLAASSLNDAGISAFPR